MSGFRWLGAFRSWGQQASAVEVARTRTSTAAKHIWPAARRGGGGAGGDPGDHVADEEQYPRFLADEDRERPRRYGRHRGGALEVQERDSTSHPLWTAL